MNYVFISCDLLLLIVPLILGFNKAVHFSQLLKPSLLASFFMAMLCSSLSYALVSSKIIGFNDDFTIGLSILTLPIEEILFYFSFPFFSIFIYENLKYSLQDSSLKWVNLSVRLFIPLLSLYIALIEDSGIYTLVVLALSTGVFILWNCYAYLKKIALTYLVCILPYLFCSYLLIGTERNTSAIWHNESQQLSLKLSTLPLEEILDGFALMAASMILFEILQKVRLR